MNEQDDSDNMKGMEATFAFLDGFNSMAQTIEINVHREIICLLAAKAPQGQGVVIDEAEIHRRVDEGINAILAGMADTFPAQATAFAKLLEMRKRQRKR